MGTREYKLLNLTLIEEKDEPGCLGCDNCCLESYDDTCAYALAEMGVAEDYCAINKIPLYRNHEKRNQIQSMA